MVAATLAPHRRPPVNWYDPSDWLDLLDHAWYGIVLIAVAGVPSYFAARNNTGIKALRDQVANGHPDPLRKDVDRLLDGIDRIEARMDRADARHDRMIERIDRIELHGHDG